MYSFTNSKGVKWFLHGRVANLKNQGQRTFYFFSKSKKEGVLDEVPAGYRVAETVSGMPVLKKDP